jgi:hypothetical protein
MIVENELYRLGYRVVRDEFGIFVMRGEDEYSHCRTEAGLGYIFREITGQIIPPEPSFRRMPAPLNAVRKWGPLTGEWSPPTPIDKAREPFSTKLRYQMIKDAGGSCQACGARAGNDVVLHIDHIKPYSKYPELGNDPNNLQVLCEQCNLGKSNIDETDWRLPRPRAAA